MNKIVKVLLTIVFVFLSNLTFAQTGSRVYEYNGNFSYRPPLGWNVTEFSGLKYKIVFGPTEGQFAVNINFVDEIFSGNLHDYVNSNLTQLETFFQNYRLLSRKIFITNSGIRGECIIINDSQESLYLKQVFYFLPAPNNKYFVITCSALDTVSRKYLSVFEECIKTFEFIN
jgi:hypothetical protein